MLCQISKISQKQKKRRINSSNSVTQLQQKGTTGISRKIKIKVVELSQKFFEKIPQFEKLTDSEFGA